MNTRSALVVLVLVAVGCFSSRVELPKDMPPQKKDGEKEKEKEQAAREDPASAAALERLTERVHGMQIGYQKKPGKSPVVSVRIMAGLGPGGGGKENPLKPLAGLAQLRELTLQQAAGLPPETFSQLEKLADLSLLDLNSSRIDDKALAAIGRLKQLKVLRLRYSSLTAKGLVHLKGMTGLRELDLGICPGLTDEAMDNLAGLTKLEVLRIPRCPALTNAGLAQIAKLRALHTLDLQGCKIDDAAMKHLAALKGLKNLNLESTGVGDAGLAALVGLPLETLTLNRSKATGAGLDKFPKLRDLFLEELRVGDATLTALAGIPYLRKLDLYETPIGDTAVERLKELKYLKELDIRSTTFSSAGLMLLVQVPRLQKIQVSAVSNGDPKTQITTDAVLEFRKANPRIVVE